MTEESGISKQERFQVFYEQNKDAMFVADPQTRKLVDCNLAAEKLTGRSKQEILKMKADDLHPPDLKDVTMAIFKRQVAGEDVTGESEVLSRNGQRIPVAINGAAIEINGRPLALGTFRDITELKKNEEILRNSKIQFEELFNNISSGVAIYKAKDDGQDFVIININKSGEHLSKVKHEEVVGKSVLEVFPGVVELGLFEVLRQVWKTGKPQHHPVSLYQDKRIMEWVENYVYKLPSGEIVAVYEDITERKNMEDALRKSEMHYRFLFENMLNGMAVCRMIFVDGRADDFIYLSVNAAFESLTGLKNVIGRKVSEIIPGFHQEDTVLLETYGRVTRTRVPEKMEIYVKSLAMWFSVSVYGIGDDCFVAIFDVITQQKENEKNLTDAKEYLNSIINAIADPVFVKDSQHRLILVNDAECALTGYPREKVIGKTDYDFFPKEQVDIFWAKDEELLKSGQENINEEEVTNAAGEKKVVVTKKTLYTDRLGNKFIVGIIRDITERKNMEKALFESEERFRSVVLNAGEWIWETNAQGQYVYCSPAVENILGFKPEELLGKYFYDLFHSDLREKAKQAAFEVFSRKESFNNFLNLNIHKDGHEVMLETSGIPIIDNQGKFLGYRGVDRDITELEKAEKALRESQGQLGLALRSAGMGVWHLNLENKIRDFDKQTCAFLGIDPETFQGTNDEFYKLVHPDDRQNLAPLLEKAISSGQLYEPEYRVIWPDGSIHYITSRATVEYDASGNPKQVNGLIWDVTERKQLEEKTQKQLHELEVFYKASLNREERILELKKEVESLKQKLQS